MPARELDASEPVDAFLLRLRTLHDAAGQPSPRKMASHARNRHLEGGSRSAVQEALAGAHLPSWKTVSAMIIVLTHGKESPEAYRAEWEAARETAGGLSTDDAGEDRSDRSHGPVPALAELPAEPRRASRGLLVGVALAGVVVGALVAVVILLTMQPPSPAAAIIEVQNKLAEGRTDYIEDPSKAYLSTKTEPFCADGGVCSIEPHRFTSGVRLIATCQQIGAEIVNYNRASETSEQNPNRYESSLWYWVELPDGQAGYISEVWLTTNSRGGLGLPRCP